MLPYPQERDRPHLPGRDGIEAVDHRGNGYGILASHSGRGAHFGIPGRLSLTINV